MLDGTEGVDFVVCQMCRTRYSGINHKHVTKCGGITIAEYLERYPGYSIIKESAKKRRPRTFEERHRQSKTLKARFQTPEGEVTRQQISKHAKEVMDSGYLQQASTHLRKLNKERQKSGELSRQGKKNWQNPELRAKVQNWHADNKELSNTFAQQARRSIKSHFTKPHQKVHYRLHELGYTEFDKEYELGYYHIDEALPSLMLAIEVDGCRWHGCTNCKLDAEAIKTASINPDKVQKELTRLGKQKGLDRSKQTYLTNHGWTVLRFWEHEINSDLDSVIGKIMDTLADLKPKEAA